MENSIFIFSDPHFGHKNIVRSVSSWDDKSGCRDFNSIEEMNKKIYSNYHKESYFYYKRWLWMNFPVLSIY